jgi:hypothetical protein
MTAVNSESSSLKKQKALSIHNSVTKTSSKALLKSCGKSENRTCSEISFKDFLDFLHTSYQINEAIQGVPNDLIDKAEIDWKNITMNEFYSSLLVVREDRPNRKTILDSANKMNDSQHLKSLTEQSKNCPNSDICHTLEENMLERTKDFKSDTSSVMSEHNVDSEVSNIVINNKNDVAKGNIQKDSGKNDIDRVTKLATNKEMSVDLKQMSSTVTSGQPKSKLLMLGKHTENKRKISKKGVLFDCKVEVTNEENSKYFEHLLKRKLNEVIQEGLLDSILPYVVPKQAPTHPAVKKSSYSDNNKSLSLTSLDNSASGHFSKEKMAIGNRRKSTTTTE